MSELQLPLLGGTSCDRTITPVWSSRVQTAASGRDQVAELWSYPLYKFTLTYEVLDSDQLALLTGFFNACRGRSRAFLFTDPEQNTVTNGQFGTGTGSVSHFQLLRSISGFAEPVLAPLSVTAVRLGGLTLATSSYSVDPLTGVVTFTSPPAAGAVLTADFTYAFRCRFLADQAEFAQFAYQLYALRRIEFQSIKP